MGRDIVSVWQPLFYVWKYADTGSGENKEGEDYKDELSLNPSRSTERASLGERERR